MRAQWARLGADPVAARAAADGGAEPADPEPDRYELPPALWPAWECFVSTWNQWRIVAGLGGIWYEGIDHASLLATMNLLGVKKAKRRAVFGHVRVLENEARALRNQQDG
ncbi:MAG: DUF1799 domain-containing protein [Burkholderiaceae bacterium]|nr:DUF1799 domain-containing protein [Burkholderiaceae bacterium]